MRLVVWVASASHLGPVLGSMGAALLLRRHLMLWAVFAPKVGDIPCDASKFSAATT